MPNPEQAMSVQMIQGSALAGRSAANAVSVCLDTLAVWIARTGHRRVLRELAEEGRLLSDVGLTREQALREAGKPFWHR
jgi:uncharacterized protein YjiS (DUF1127 family)